MYPLQLGHNLYLKSGGVAFLIKSRVHRNRLWAWYSNKCMHHQGGHSSLLSRRRSNSPLVTVSFRTATSVQTVERCQYVSTWVFCRNYCTWHTLKEGRSLSILYWGISPLKIKAVKRHLDFEFSKIQKSKKIAIARSVPVKEKPRLQSISVDISAVEDDGDGGDISSRNTTPEKQVEIIDIISPPNTSALTVVNLSVDRKPYRSIKHRRSVRTGRKVTSSSVAISGERSLTTATIWNGTDQAALNKFVNLHSYF